MVNIVAELSANHNQDLDLMTKLVTESCEINQIDTIKLQCFFPESCTSDKRNFVLNEGIWKGESLYGLMKKAYTPPPLVNLAQKIISNYKKKLMISINNIYDLDYYSDLKINYVKLPSPESSNYFLANEILNRGYNLVLSTGIMFDEELEYVYNKVKTSLSDSQELFILHCISNYPTELEEVNLNRLDQIRKICPKAKVGISDHSKGTIVPSLSVAKGAEMIEKHIKFNNKIKTLDDQFSLSVSDFSEMVNIIRTSESILGNSLVRSNIDSHKINPYWKNSISAHAKTKLKKGEKLSSENIIFLRPGDGISPKDIDQFIYRNIKKDIEKGFPINYDDLD